MNRSSITMMLIIAASLYPGPTIGQERGIPIVELQAESAGNMGDLQHQEMARGRLQGEPGPGYLPDVAVVNHTTQTLLVAHPDFRTLQSYPFHPQRSNSPIVRSLDVGVELISQASIHQEHLHILDGARREWVVFDRSGAEVRRSSFQGNLIPGGSLVVHPDTLIINALVFTPSGVGYPLHMATPDRGIEHSFGALISEFRIDRRAALHRRLARDSGGRIWVAHERADRVEVWETFEAPATVLQRDRADLHHGIELGWGRDQLAAAHVSAVQVDSEGLMWRSWVVPSRPGEVSEISSLLEVLNPIQAKIAHQLRLPGKVTAIQVAPGACCEMTVTSFRKQQSGAIEYSVNRVWLPDSFPKEQRSDS